MDSLLKISNLKTYFFMPEGVYKAVDGISYHVNKADTLGIVGESGCGKSVSALSILRLIHDPGRIVAGNINFEDVELTSLSLKEMRKIRGNDISMVFQEPMSSLNPVFSIGYQLSEAICIHQGISKRQARSKAIDILHQVGIPDPQKKIKEFPHSLSGGMRQRVMIAMALSCEPKLLIADEPTTALDVTIQAQILELMQKVKDERKMSMLLITHDLGIISEVAQRVVVMYAGKIVESADVDVIFNNSFHPYTIGLYESLPSFTKDKKKVTLHEIPGIVPNALEFPTGCHFWPRCAWAMKICKKDEPQYKEIDANHFVACWLAS